MLKRKDLWETFKYEYTKNEGEIKTAISQIVYPSSKEFSSRKFLRFYKKQFEEIIKLIKTMYREYKTAHKH